jgi:uncharacterized RDD family membrane protein YckC
MKQSRQGPVAPGVETTLSIDTPENVVFGYQIAGIGSRFMAALIDTLLILVLQVIANFTLLLLGATILGSSPLQGPESSSLAWLVALLGLVAFAFLWGYYIFFEALWNGQSPGKRWLGLRVIRNNGTPAEFSEIVIRNLVRLVDFLPLYYGIGVITMFIDGRSRRLGDLAAGTLVVYEAGALTLADLAPASAPGLRESTSSSPQALPVARLEADDVALASNFLRRRQELHNGSEMAVEIASFLRQKMSLPQEPLSEAEALSLLERVAGEGQRPSPGL